MASPAAVAAPELPTPGPTAPADGSPASPSEPESVAAPPAAGIRRFLHEYGRMLWWCHSLYALGLGLSVIAFAQRGFAHARWLSISLVAVWLIVLLFFRWFGAGRARAVEGRKAKVRFYVMTYVLKNLYQGMLFFLLPFYWRSATFDSPTQWFVVIIAVCALLSTLDVVFDHVLMRWKIAASSFYFFTLFCTLNLAIPALFPNSRALVTLVAAAGVSAVAFWTMHIPLRQLGRPSVVVLLVTWTVGSVAGAYYGRAAVPPVAMHLESGAVGPRILEDGRLAFEATSLHTSIVGEELFAVTNVQIPGGKGDRLVHVWRKDDEVVQRSADVDPKPFGTIGLVRLRSRLDSDHLPERRVGGWSVDVETEGGQLVGRVRFQVIE